MEVGITGGQTVPARKKTVIANVKSDTVNLIEGKIDGKRKTMFELPKCDKKYYKKSLDGKKIIEMTAEEKAIKDQEIQDQVDAITKEQLIIAKQNELLRQQAINELISENKLNADGSLKK